MGSVPLGANTVPVMLVVAVPAQTVCWRQRLVQVGLEPHTLALAAPQMALPLHVPQSMTVPQVSVAMPQLKPWTAQVLGVQVMPPQTPTWGLEPPPQV